MFAPWSQAAGVFIHEMNKFETSKGIKTLREHPITSICAAPTLYRSLVVAKDIESLNPSQNMEGSMKLRQCLSAGEPLNEEVIKKWRNNTNLTIREGILNKFMNVVNYVKCNIMQSMEYKIYSTFIQVMVCLRPRYW